MEDRNAKIKKVLEKYSSNCPSCGNRLVIVSTVPVGGAESKAIAVTNLSLQAGTSHLVPIEEAMCQVIEGEMGLISELGGPWNE